MPTIVQFRRGTEAQSDAFTGNVGELSVDTTNETIRVHDGSTAGGSRLATYAEVSDRMQVANVQSLVTASINNVIDSAPGTLDTLNELAAAIGDDADFLSKIQANVDQKLGATASVTLTGDVTGTASFSSNAVSITTTIADDSHNHIIGNVDGLQNELDSKIEVANAIATFSTLTQLGNTNSYIAGVQSNLDTTNANVDQKLGATASVTLTGAVTGTANFSANAVSITTTATSDPTITLAGDLTGSVTLTNLGDGTLTAAVVDDSHNHSSSSGAFTVGTDLTVSGGDIILSGTGRIQGIDTVSAGTDAANKTYVDNAVAGVVDSAPAALDTLNELAAALGDDANFSTTVTTSIGEKLAKASNLSDLTNASTARTNLGLGTAATTAATDYATAAQGATADSAVQNLADLSITATAAEINKLDGVTATTAELNYVDGVTSNIQTQLNGKQASGSYAVTTNNLSDLSNAATARTNLGLGSLATLSTVNAATITDNSVGAAELNVSGNGTTAQFLRSDGDGTFTWATPTDTNTTYTGGTGITLSGTTFSLTAAGAGAGTYGSTADGTKVDSITLDAYGRVTAVATGTTGDILGVTAGSGLTGGGTSGTVTVNVGAGSYITVAADTVSVDATSAATASKVVARDASGDFSANIITAVDFNATSDETMKTNVTTIESSLEKLDAIRGVNFNWKKDDRYAMGVIAQEVEEVIPEVVSIDGEGLRSVNYGALVGLLIEAVKDLKNEVEELKRK